MNALCLFFKILSQDLKKFLDEAPHGVIFFTLGSQVRVDSISTEKRNAFMYAFSNLPQRVIWKWEGGRLPGQPDNIMTAKWMPQLEVLCKYKIFIYLNDICKSVILHILRNIKSLRTPI